MNYRMALRISQSDFGPKEIVIGGRLPSPRDKVPASD
jgi:hypothetical protein